MIIQNRYIKVTYDVEPAMSIISPLSASDWAEKMAHEGKVLPDLKYRNRNAYRILLNDIHVGVEYDGRTYDFVFKRGYVWDLASVPGIGKVITDNDDPRTIIASMVHDYFFGIHQVDFNTANRIFYWTARGCGMAVPPALIEFFSIQSFIGRIKWRTLPMSRGYMRDYVDFFERGTING